MALAGGNAPYQQAMNNEISLQSKLAQALSAQQLNEAKAAEIEDGRAMAAPEAVRRNAMLGHGVPLAEEGAVDKYFQTGELGGRYAKPADDVGPVLPSPDWAKNLDNVRRTIMAATNALTLGDKNSANVATSAGKFREQALSDAIINGTANRNAVGGAQAAGEGKPLFNSDASGAVLDQFTGNLDTNNPMAGASIGLKNAQAAKARQELQDGMKAGNIVVQTAADGTVMLVNKTNGVARPATSEDGVPMKGNVRGAGAGGRQLPTSALKMQQEELDAISTAGSINSDLASIQGQIEGGQLQLGPVNNLVGTARNMAGMSNENSRNLQTFKATLERLRNDSLRLNKGVQTDGDAQRAWNELLDNINDPDVVKQRLEEIQRINQRAASIRQMNIDGIRANFGLDPMDTTSNFQQPAAVGGGTKPAAPAGGGWSIKRKGQ